MVGCGFEQGITTETVPLEKCSLIPEDGKSVIPLKNLPFRKTRILVSLNTEQRQINGENKYIMSKMLELFHFIY